VRATLESEIEAIANAGTETELVSAVQDLVQTVATIDAQQVSDVSGAVDEE
jgi:hypothetical protein